MRSPPTLPAQLRVGNCKRSRERAGAAFSHPNFLEIGKSDYGFATPSRSLRRKLNNPRFDPDSGSERRSDLNRSPRALAHWSLGLHDCPCVPRTESRSRITAAGVNTTQHPATAQCVCEVLLLGALRLDEAICVSPKRMSGTPCFRGTRVPVQSLIDFHELYSLVKREQINCRWARSLRMFQKISSSITALSEGNCLRRLRARPGQVIHVRTHPR